MSVPENPLYGDGVFRRRIRLTGEPRLVTAELEDSFHAFRVRLHHDGERVTAVDSQALRYPVTLCPEAGAMLEGFVGGTLSADRRELRQRQHPGQHCTHQYDLAWLCMAQALRGTPQRIYDIAVPDYRSGCTDATLRRDGAVAMQWQLQEGYITAPAVVAGRSPFIEFGRWASAAYAGEDLEAAYVLQIGVFVAGARRLDFRAVAGTPNDVGKLKPGSCFTYQPERIGQGFRLGHVMYRDFTDAPDQLLKFL